MAFNTPSKLAIIKQKPVNPSTEVWTRPVDWPTVTDTAGEVQFLASDVLNATYNLETTFLKPAAQNLYINWGDGSTTTVSTNTSVYTSHTYAVGTGTVCSRGYTTFKIRVYVDSGATIDTCKFRALGFNGTGGTEEYTSNNPCGLLEAYYGNGTLPSLGMVDNFRDTVILVTFGYLEYVKCPSAMTYASGLVNTFATTSSFGGCPVLAKIVLPTTYPVGSFGFGNTFSGCGSLIELNFPTTGIVIDNISGTFSSCTKLRSISFPSNMDSCTTISNAFANCYALGSIDLPALPACTSYANAFQNCTSLTSFNLKSFTSTAQTIALTAMFSGCNSLVNVNLPSTVVAGTVLQMTSTFATCPSLLAITFPEVDIDTLSSTFSGCSNLQSVTLPTSCPSLTTMLSTFQSCGSLGEVTLPTTVTAGTISLNGTFTSCTSLSSITIPSSYNINSLSGTFSGCNNLVTCNLPNNAQNSITSITSAFQNCNSLINLTLPTSMTAAGTMSNTFANCSSLESVVLPATMNSSVSISSTFSGCTNLTSVTFPTSMTTMQSNGISFPITGCMSLKNVVLPANVGTLVSSLLISSTPPAVSLQTVTLPTTQTTAITSLSGLFNYLPGLTGAFNVDKLGNNSTGATVYINGANIMGANIPARRLLSLDFTCKFSVFAFNGTVTRPMALNSLRLRNSGTGQYAGTSPQINVSYTSLDTAALNQLFTDLPTITAKTINITGCPGAATCTRSIATAKGWTITG